MDTPSQEKIIAKPDSDLINHFFFANYLPKEELTTIEINLSKGASFVVGFYSGEELKFIAVFDFELDCLHVRHVVGFFGRLHDTLDKFSQGLAKFTNKKYISFKTEKKAVAKWAEDSGYTFEPIENEYRKSLH